LKAEIEGKSLQHTTWCNISSAILLTRFIFSIISSNDAFEGSSMCIEVDGGGIGAAGGVEVEGGGFTEFESELPILRSNTVVF
jgi:hypothetical protein